MLSEGRILSIERPPNINYAVEEGTLMYVNGVLVITREEFSLDKSRCSAARFGRWRYKAAITKPIRSLTPCYFDPAANLITDDGSPKVTLPSSGPLNVGSAILANLNVVSGIPTDNWTVRCVGKVDSQIDTPVQTVKNTGYTGIVAMSGIYTGLSSGTITASISRRGDLSGVSPRCALVQISGVLSGEYEVVSNTPISIGDGLFITFGTEGEFGDWLFGGDTWLIDVVPSNVGNPIPDIGNTSIVLNVTSSGQYVHPTDETYTISVQTPGSSGNAKVLITSASGLDDIGPLTVNDGVAIPLGSRGGFITFSGITNLAELDYWVVTCTAPVVDLTQGTHNTGYSGSVSASGEFLSPVDDIYTIEIVKGGPLGVAEATITSVENDNVETLSINTGLLQVGSYGLLIEFTNSGELAPGDTWTISCVGKKTEWTVTGDITGEITPIVVSDVPYKSDNETMEFYIHTGSIQTEVDDIFTFSTFAAAIPAGVFLTEGTVTTEDMVFLLNSNKQVI